MYYACYYDFPIGRLAVVENGASITHVLFSHDTPPKGAVLGETELTKRAAAQLGEYLRGTRRVFDLPLHGEGTVFQRRVWDALLRIPYGKTCSYMHLAQAVGSPNGFRAVGAANGRNPIAIVIPCHRVIGSSGTLVGYGGGLELKKRLLELEAQGRD